MDTLKGRTTVANRQPGDVESENDDDHSSQTMIITKTVSYDVASDRASAKVIMTSCERF
jgi:hypothetical protein